MRKKLLLIVFCCIGFMDINHMHVSASYAYEIVLLGSLVPCERSSVVYERKLTDQKRLHARTGAFADPGQKLIYTIKEDRKVENVDHKILSLLMKIMGLVSHNNNEIHEITFTETFGATYELHNNSSEVKEALINEIYDRVYYRSYHYIGNHACIQGPLQHSDTKLGLVVEL